MRRDERGTITQPRPPRRRIAPSRFHPRVFVHNTFSTVRAYTRRDILKYILMYKIKNKN